jgi:hypothetical protein
MVRSQPNSLPSTLGPAKALAWCAAMVRIRLIVLSSALDSVKVSWCGGMVRIQVTALPSTLGPAKAVAWCGVMVCS